MFRYILTSFLFLCLSAVSVLGQETRDRDYWIEKYLSVSFPLDNIKVNSSFGVRTDPFSGKSRKHNGLDLAARYEEVLAMFDGEVIHVGHDSSSGRYVVLQHGSYRVTYCHLSQVLAKVGQRVFAGDVVAISGSTGRSTGPHLHITARNRGELEDPYELLLYVRDTKQRCIRELRMDESRISSPRDFIDAYKDIAMRQQQRYGIPSSVILAQMAFESGWGTSALARQGRNFFGIKCSRKWLQDGLPYSLHDDDRKGEKFCNFSSVEEGVDYHTRLLMGDRYARCWRYGPTDYHNWLVSIKACGYATRRDYVARCEKIIVQHRLYLLDRQAETM